MNTNWSARKEDGMCHDSNFYAEYDGEFWSTTSAPIIDSDGKTVALAVDLNDSLTTDEFNRRMDLIAAAPDLLAALEEMAAQHYCGCNHPACWGCKRDEMCKQAIAKAKGEKV